MSSYRLEATLSGHSGAIYTLAYFDDRLLSGAGDGMVAAWDIAQRRALPFAIKVGHPVFALAAHQQKLYVGQGAGGLHIIDLELKKEVKLLQVHSKGIFDICLLPEQNLLLALGGDGTLSLIRISDGSLRHQIPLSGSKLRKALLSPDQRLLYVASSDGYIYTLDTQYFNILHSTASHSGGCYALLWQYGSQPKAVAEPQLTPAEPQLISGGRDAHLRYWQPGADGSLQALAALPAHHYAIYDLKALDEHRFASASRDKLVKVWHGTEAQRLLATGKYSHTRSVNCLCYAQGLLCSAGDDRQLRLWAVH